MSFVRHLISEGDDDDDDDDSKGRGRCPYKKKYRYNKKGQWVVLVVNGMKRVLIR